MTLPTTLNKTAVSAAEYATYKFNSISNNFSGDITDGIDLQLSLVFEELTETIGAFEEENELELLDGAVDTFVTVCGLLQRLQHAGFDVNKALQKVTDNNLTKFPKTIPVKVQYPTGWTTQYNKKYQCHVIKDENGKTRKPHGFAPVDLFDCVPFTLFPVVAVY